MADRHTSFHIAFPLQVICWTYSIVSGSLGFRVTTNLWQWLWFTIKVCKIILKELHKEICKHSPHVALWSGAKGWDCSSGFTWCALVVDSGNWSWLQQTVLLKSVCMCESLLSMKPGLLQDLAPMASLVVIECREWVSFVPCPSREGTLALTDFPLLQMGRLRLQSFPQGLSLPAFVWIIYLLLSVIERWYVTWPWIATLVQVNSNTVMTSCDKYTVHVTSKQWSC